MAVDRENPRTEEYFDPHHPALLRLIRYTVKNAGKAGIPVGICGDLGGDETLTEFFVKEGVDELSVPAIQDPSAKGKNKGFGLK